MINSLLSNMVTGILTRNPLINSTGLCYGEVVENLLFIFYSVCHLGQFHLWQQHLCTMKFYRSEIFEKYFGDRRARNCLYHISV